MCQALTLYLAILALNEVYGQYIKFFIMASGLPLVVLTRAVFASAKVVLCHRNTRTGQCNSLQKVYVTRARLCTALRSVQSSTVSILIQHHIDFCLYLINFPSMVIESGQYELEKNELN
jgi:hypothetical protein